MFIAFQGYRICSSSWWAMQEEWVVAKVLNVCVKIFGSFGGTVLRRVVRLVRDNRGFAL